jgi:hypothetical protein
MITSSKLVFNSFAVLIAAGLSLTVAPHYSSAGQVRDHRPCCTETRTTGCKYCSPYKPYNPNPTSKAPGGVTGGKHVKPPPR